MTTFNTLPLKPALLASVETLAERCAAIVRDEFGVAWLRLRLSKPGAVRGAKAVGVVIERGTRG
jgi:dihydroneopterin aldolase